MKTPLWLTRSGISAAALVLCACGGAGGDTGTTPSQQDSTQPPATSQQTPTEDSATAQAKMNNAIAAAKQAASTDPLCAISTMGDFYWEIGTANGTQPIVSGSQGSGTVTASSRFNIASASKFVFGAYVLQKKGIDAVRNDPSLYAGMRFMSGYTGIDDSSCAGTATVGACYTAGNANNTALPNPATTGLFDYDGDHDQKLATVDLGMANFTSHQVDLEYQATMGLPSGISMAPLDPLMAGGLIASATDYAQFLRMVMTQQLVIGAHLGDDAVCASSAACPGMVAYSPIDALGEPWHYSYNHWVESQYGNGTVDAYSSPGKWGFYPWITPDRKYYGIVSRHDPTPTAYGVSVLCGRQIRLAFLNALKS